MRGRSWAWIFGVLLAACAPKASPSLAQEVPVETFVREVAELAEKHAWNAIVERADDAHRATQLHQMGMSTEQYVAELLGLHRVDNSIDAMDDGVDARDLARIQDVLVEEVALVGDVFEARGVVVLKGGARLTFTLIVTTPPDGTFRLSGAVG